MNGKGSKRRPMRIGRKEFERRWDAVFKKSEKQVRGPKGAEIN